MSEELLLALVVLMRPPLAYDDESARVHADVLDGFAAQRAHHFNRHAYSIAGVSRSVAAIDAARVDAARRLPRVRVASAPVVIDSGPVTVIGSLEGVEVGYHVAYQRAPA